MRKSLTVAAVILGLLLATAAAAELLFGTWSSDDNPLDRSGLARNVAIPVAASALYDGGHDFTYQRDRWGFRGAGIEPSQVSVLTVGGNTTEQAYLPDDATWQAVMQRDLRAAGGDAVVANAGLAGQGTIGHLRAMAEWFPKVPGLRPHFVLFSVGIEDAGADGGAGAETTAPAGRLARLGAHSALWQAAARLAGAQAPRPLLPEHHRLDLSAARWTDKPEQPDWRPEQDGVLSAYQDRLRKLAQQTHAMGAVPVFVTQTRADFKLVDGRVRGMVEGEGMNGVDHYIRLSAYNRVTRQVCEEEGLLCLDLAREVTFEPGDFYDYLHNTPQGAAKIGRWLASKLSGLV